MAETCGSASMAVATIFSFNDFLFSFSLRRVLRYSMRLRALKTS